MSAGGSARSGGGVDATTETEQGGRADAALRLLDQLARADGANGLASSSEGDASQTTLGQLLLQGNTLTMPSMP